MSKYLRTWLYKQISKSSGKYIQIFIIHVQLLVEQKKFLAFLVF